MTNEETVAPALGEREGGEREWREGEVEGRGKRYKEEKEGGRESKKREVGGKGEKMGDNCSTEGGSK